LSKNEDSQINAVLTAILVVVCLLIAFLALFDFNGENSQRVSPPTTIQPATHDWYGQTLEVAGKACFFEFVIINEKGAKDLHCASLEKGSLVQVVGDYVPFVRGLSIPINLWPAKLVNGGQAGYISDDDPFQPAVGKTYLLKADSFISDGPEGSYMLNENGERVIAHEHWSAVLEKKATLSRGQYVCQIKVIGLPIDGYITCDSLAPILNREMVASSQ
jgi:hypothetical protein